MWGGNMERLFYPILIVLLFLLILFVMEPFLYHLYAINTISSMQYSLLYLGLNVGVTVTISLILYVVGKGKAGVRPISMLIMLNTLLDLYRLSRFPTLSQYPGILTMFTGIYIFAYGVVVSNRISFKKGVGLFFLLIGSIYMIRFPVTVDLAMAYVQKNLFSPDRLGFYLNIIVYTNYVIVLLELIALDFLLREKHYVKKIDERIEMQYRIRNKLRQEGK